MKLVWCDGRALWVRDVGPVIFRLEAREVPLAPAGGYRIVEDEAARAYLRDLLGSGLYRKCDGESG